MEIIYEAALARHGNFVFVQQPPAFSLSPSAYISLIRYILINQTYTTPAAALLSTFSIRKSIPRGQIVEK
jgi:hypothetical protein